MPSYLDLASAHYENFPVGSFLVPRRQRLHLRRIYAFARTADDLADEARDAEALAEFRGDFTSHLEGGEAPPVPLFLDLVISIRELDLPHHLFFDLLDAFALDLEVNRHDRESLLSYCRKSADPVGRLVLRVFGHDEPRLDALSDRICTSLQIVNHLQDIREDLLERDRIYMPEEDLRRFAVAPDELGRELATPGVRLLVEHWTKVSAEWLREGWELTRLVRGRLALELRAILHGVALVVGHLRRLDHDPLATHIRLKSWEKAHAVGRSLLSSKMPPEFG